MDNHSILEISIQHDGVALLVLNRPTAKNALNLELRQALSNAFIQLQHNIAAYAPIAVQQIKEVAQLGSDMSLQAGLTLERKAFQILFDTRDQKEGVNAFFEKRPAHYTGE